LTSAVPPNSNGYPSATAYQDQYLNSSALAICDAQQAFPVGSKSHTERVMQRPSYSIPAGNQQNVYDHLRDGRAVSQNSLDSFTGHPGGRYDDQLILTRSHEKKPDDGREGKHRGNLTYDCASCARRGRRCTGCESWRPAG
jgi:hypothetical protein